MKIFKGMTQSIFVSGTQMHAYITEYFKMYICKHIYGQLLDAGGCRFILVTSDFPQQFVTQNRVDHLFFVIKVYKRCIV